VLDKIREYCDERGLTLRIRYTPTLGPGVIGGLDKREGGSVVTVDASPDLEPVDKSTDAPIDK